MSIKVMYLNRRGKMEPAEKWAIKKAILRALAPADCNYNRTYWSQWLYDRLTTLAIYSVTDKTKGKTNQIKCLRMLAGGMSYPAVAKRTGYSIQTTKKYISLSLDWVINNTPERLLKKIPVETNKPTLIGACLHCKGTLFWDDLDGIYWCLACARRFNDTQVKNNKWTTTTTLREG
jgi:hypothetical protein